MTADAPSVERTRERRSLAALVLAGTTASFMLTVVIPIQSRLPSLLDADPAGTAWVVTASLLAAAVATPIAGRLGDMYGKRRVALALLMLVAAGSVLSALTSSLLPMVIGRALQGTGMGIIPLAISILRDILPGRRLSGATALVSATIGVGSALSQPIGAALAEGPEWHLIFWVCAGLAAASSVLVVRLVPVDAHRSGGRFDWVGAIGLSVGLTGLLSALAQGNEWGWTATSTLCLLTGGVVVLGGWAWYEARRADPLVDLRVTAQPTVLVTNLASVAMGFILYGLNIIFPQLLQAPASVGGLDLSVFEASLIMMPTGLVMLATSAIISPLGRRIGSQLLLVASGTIVGGAYLVASFLAVEVWHILVINIVVGVGSGMGFAAMPALIMRAVPRAVTGAANGVNALMRSLGTSSAAAVLASVLAASSVSWGGGTTPTHDGFQAALWIGAAAAVLAVLTAALIPRPGAARDD